MFFDNYRAQMAGATVSVDGARGIVPQPLIADRTKFLRGDGAWVAISGGGDMLAANNLGDVLSAASAQTNLGLGTGNSPTFTGLTITGTLTAQGNLLNFNTGAGNAPYIQHDANGLDVRGGTAGVRILNNAGTIAVMSFRDTGHGSGSGFDVSSTGNNNITGILAVSESIYARALTAIPAGGTAGAGLLVSSTANFGVFFGSGAPTLSAAQGSIYLRSDGSSTSTRCYINTNGTTGWAAITTAS